MIFKDFLEYWYYARLFSYRQKEIIFSSLSDVEQKYLTDSCGKGHWDEVINRDILDDIIDEVNMETGFDLLDIHYKVMHNKSVYVPTCFWDYVLSKFEDYEPNQVIFILGGIKAIECHQNKQVTLLVPFYSEYKD